MELKEKILHKQFGDAQQKVAYLKDILERLVLI